MNAMVDDLRIFLGDIPADEHEVRRKIGTLQRCASYQLVRTESHHARVLCDLAAETGAYWHYRPATMAALNKAADYMKSLLADANKAEDLRGVA